MSKTNSNAYDQLNLIFNNTNMANIGDVSGIQGSATVGSLYIALYTVAPTDTTNGTESTYTNYARVTLARTSGNFLVENIDPPQVTNVSDIVFPTSGDASSDIVAWAICFELAGNPKYFANVSNVEIKNGTIPTISAGQLKIVEK